MPQIKVVMSSYNGKENIGRQLDSILSQTADNVSIFVRDDGSTDSTVEILRTYVNINSNIQYIEGMNIGWRASFLEALSKCGTSDYFAFSDQDDVWGKDKLERCLNAIKDEDDRIPTMIHCNRLSVDNNLIPLKKQSIKHAKPCSRKNALTQEYAQGCTILMNSRARDLVLRYKPCAEAPHDFWTGLICYYFGKVYYLDDRLIKHVQYRTNQSSAGNINKGRFKRLKSMFFSEKSYYNPASDLIYGYSDLLDEDTLAFLHIVQAAKTSYSARLKLLVDTNFKRYSKLGTLALKVNVLLGRF